MKFEVGDFNASGTSYKGEIDTTYNHLVEVFGEPTEIGDGDKVRCEWIVRFEDGTIATIYDWKEYQPIENVTNWHIGGFDIRAVKRVSEVV